MLRHFGWILVILTISAVLISGCGNKASQPLGSKENPIKMALVPSLDSKTLVISGEKLSTLLHKETGLYYKVDVATSYTAVITAIGAGTADVGWLSPIPYVIAHDRFGTKVILTTVRNKSAKYWSVIVTRNDSGINKLSDLKGKKFAFGDPVSTSGTIYPKHMIRKLGVKPEKFFSQSIYAGAHDRVIMAVYNKQVDAGAIYGGPASDAREKVVGTFKDVMQKTHIIARSVEIPNDTVSVRKDMPKDLVEKVAMGLVKISSSPEGQKAIFDLYGIDGFIFAKDSDYDSVREVAKSENVTLEQIDKKKK